MRLQGTAIRPGKVDGFIAPVGPMVPRDGPVVVVVPAPSPAVLPSGAAAWILEDSAPRFPTEGGTGAVVGRIAPDLFRPGDRVAVNGGAGEVVLAEIEAAPVVTAFLEREDGRILLLRRSDRVGSFRGAWAGVSGFLEDPTPLDQAVREIREETGMVVGSRDLRATGRTILARDTGRIFLVHPFRFRVRHPQVRLDWEHVESEWVVPSVIRARATVPKLGEAWDSVAPVGGAPVHAQRRND